MSKTLDDIINELNRLVDSSNIEFLNKSYKLIIMDNVSYEYYHEMPRVYSIISAYKSYHEIHGTATSNVSNWIYVDTSTKIVSFEKSNNTDQIRIILSDPRYNLYISNVVKYKINPIDTIDKAMNYNFGASIDGFCGLNCSGNYVVLFMPEDEYDEYFKNYDIKHNLRLLKQLTNDIKQISYFTELSTSQFDKYDGLIANLKKAIDDIDKAI